MARPSGRQRPEDLCRLLRGLVENSGRRMGESDMVLYRSTGLYAGGRKLIGELYMGFCGSIGLYFVLQKLIGELNMVF